MTKSQKPAQPRPVRATVACNACRQRKVRCDVARRGACCTNCFLDQKTCIVAARASTGRITRAQGTRKAPTVNVRAAPCLDPSGRRRHTPATAAAVTAHSIPSGLNSSCSPPALLGLLLQNNGDTVDDHDGPEGAAAGELHFTAYRFISSNFLQRLGQDDVKFLEDQGCHRLPRRDLLSDMLDRFFRYIHPLLPLFDEPRFWTLYHPLKYANRRDSRPAEQQVLSLFVLQAMLFAASSFVAATKLQQLGFHHTRHARRCLYRRAKLLYSLETDTDPLSLARGALLLSLWCPRDNPQQINSWWLSCAIRHARTAKAHEYHLAPSLSDADTRERKRVWWSCIVRDRVMSLGLRQPMLITKDMFDFSGGWLTVADLQGDAEGPSVYSQDLRRVLLVITAALCELCSLLTGVLNLVYPSITPTEYQPEDRPHILSHTRRLREEAKTWHQDITDRLGGIHFNYQSNSSVILMTNLLRIYFHSALVLIANHEIRIKVEFMTPDGLPLVPTGGNRLEIHESTLSITESLHDLMRLDLVKYLPASAILCTAQPFLLCLLDQALASPDTSATDGRLSVVLEAMKVYKSVYDNADLILASVDQISREARTISLDGHIKGWADILNSHPKAYVRCTLALDDALARGSLLPEAIPVSEVAGVMSSPMSETCKMNVDDEKEGPGGDDGSVQENTNHGGSNISLNINNDPGAVGGALVMPNGELLGDATGVLQSPQFWGDDGLLGSDIFLQNLLESYLVDGGN